LILKADGKHRIFLLFATKTEFLDLSDYNLR